MFLRDRKRGCEHRYNYLVAVDGHVVVVNCLRHNLVMRKLFAAAQILIFLLVQCIRVDV